MGLGVIHRGDTEHMLMDDNGDFWIFNNLKREFSKPNPTKNGRVVETEIPADEFNPFDGDAAYRTVVMKEYMVDGKIIYAGYDSVGKRPWIHKQQAWRIPGETP